MKKEIIITSGQETEVVMTLVHQVMVEGKFEISRMTFEEIAAAGIDVSAPENQCVVKVDVTLTYGKDDVETSFVYNPTTGESKAKPTIVTTSDGQKRQIVPVVIHGNHRNSNNDSSDGTGGVTPVDPNYLFSKETAIAYLDIPVGVSSIKEFFNVHLHIINNASSEFSMLDNVIDLNIPNGLTLINSHMAEAKSKVVIGEIKGQTTETITWILRGDVIGEYYLSADYSGVLSEFNEPISTQFVATEPIEVYGLSNLKLRIEIPEELDHGTFYYNMSLCNEGKVDVYRPAVDTEDVLIEMQLFNDWGADISDSLQLDAEEIDELQLAESIEGVLDVLPAGGRLTKHYMNVEQTTYTERTMALEKYAYEVSNTYGMEIEFVTYPVSYFKSNLSANINAAEKAEITFTTNESAFAYLITDENYIYWSMYASTGEVATALTTNEQETLWELLAFAAGDGDFKALFGSDDDELIQAILLEAMELSVEKEDYSKYYTMLDWTKLVKDWVKKEGYGQWATIVTNWLTQKAENLTKEQLSKLAESIGKSLPHTLELISAEYRWEAYKAVYEGEYLDLDNFIIEKWKVVIEEYYYEATEYYEETDASVMLHELFSSEGFETIWKEIGVALDRATKIVTAAEDTSEDISLYLIAQSNLNSCNLFLDTIINSMSEDTRDAERVRTQADVIKRKMNELDPIGNLAEHLLDQAFWKGMNYLKKTATAELKLTPNSYVQLVKTALKLTRYMGRKVFNVEGRQDIADNIRFISCITIALRNGIWEARSAYLTDKSEKNAQEYMQLISYLLNMRAIGESQVAQFGISYEVLPGAFDSRELFYAVRDMSGATDVVTWIEWRDFVEDKISMLRVQLLKNPMVTDVTQETAPVVTFDYSKGETEQSFSGQYEYSLNKGRTWITCEGKPIKVEQSSYSRELMVRRVDFEGTTETRTASLTIYGPSSFSANLISIFETKNGYRVENLNSRRTYEVTFSEEPVSYEYGDSLNIRIPEGRTSYEHLTETECKYFYIRTVTDKDQYASYVVEPKFYPMSTVVVNKEGQGTVTGAGDYEYGEKAALIATPAENYLFEGWYELHTLVSLDEVFEFQMYENREITAKFVRDTSDWVVDTSKGFITGIQEGTSAEEVISYFQNDQTTVTVTNPDGTEADKIRTGCVVNVEDDSYKIMIQGDVNGDAVVDMQDLYRMIEHINWDTMLEGVYLEAGCICQNEDIDIFDLYEQLALINNRTAASVYSLKRTVSPAYEVKTFA